jgi:hypothetical protein
VPFAPIFCTVKPLILLFRESGAKISIYGLSRGLTVSKGVIAASLGANVTDAEQPCGSGGQQ